MRQFVKTNFFFKLCIIAVLMATALNVHGQIIDNDDKIKAVFMYNFTKYMTWPEGAFKEKFRIGIMNNEPLTSQLEQMAKVKKIHNARFEVVRIMDLEDIESLQMVYVSNEIQFPLEKIYLKIGTKPILLVTSDYSNSGSMINFVRIGQRVRFEMTLEEIEKQGIRVSRTLRKLSIEPTTAVHYPRSKKEENIAIEPKSNKYPELDKVKLIDEDEITDEEYDELVAKLELEMKKVSKQDKEILNLKHNVTDLESAIEFSEEQLEIVQDKISSQSKELIKLSSSIGLKEQEYLDNIDKVKQSEEKLETAKLSLEKTKETLSNTALLLDNQKLINTLTFLVLIIIGVLGAVSYKNYRKQKKQALVISEQKLVAENQRDEIQQQHFQLEEKNREITDSINYAKRIQEAILPPMKLVKSYLADSFIYYEPKDIVAGDFYWMEAVDDHVIFAAADCTGHGVPGAMVSVVCSNALNRSVKEFGIKEPAAILDKTLEIVIERFEKSEEEVKDGMDIALCSYNPKTKKLQYAGAHNPLWIVRKNGTEMEEIKGDKQPIGKYAEKKPFTNHTVQLEKGDSIYMTSDGYVDQFGGERGKKFKSLNFKRLLLSIKEKSIDEQFTEIKKAFQHWKGDLEQLDDVCVIGFRA